MLQTGISLDFLTLHCLSNSQVLRGRGPTYGKQLVGHRHRRNRPCTFRSCNEEPSQHSARQVKKGGKSGLHPSNPIQVILREKCDVGGWVDIDVGAVLLSSCCVANRQRNTSVQNGQRARESHGGIVRTTQNSPIVNDEGSNFLYTGDKLASSTGGRRSTEAKAGRGQSWTVPCG